MGNKNKHRAGAGYTTNSGVPVISSQTTTVENECYNGKVKVAGKAQVSVPGTKRILSQGTVLVVLSSGITMRQGYAGKQYLYTLRVEKGEFGGTEVTAWHDQLDPVEE